MSAPAAVLGDKIMGVCAIHLIPGPMGAPVPGPPMPFQAPLMQGLAMKVLISNKPAAVLGSWGLNTPPHVGLHPSDPSFTPVMQKGTVTLQTSTTVLFEGKPAAKMGSTAIICQGIPNGKVVASAMTVLIGG